MLACRLRCCLRHVPTSIIDCRSQTHNFGSYETVAATAVDTICSMDTYGKLGDTFGWINQLNSE